MRGPSIDCGSGFPNSCAILRRSFSSSCRRIISSKAWNCSCSACCCFIRATRVFSSSSCCCKAKVCANYSSSSCSKKEHAQGQEQRGVHQPRQNTKPLQTPSYSQVIPKGSAKGHQQTAFSGRKLQLAGHRSRASWTKGRKTTVLPSLFHGGRLISSVLSLKSHSSRAKQTAEVIALPTEPQILVHAELLDCKTWM